MTEVDAVTMRYRTVVFDMDGTLADTSPGIFQSYRYAARCLGVPEPSDDFLRTHLGGSLNSNIADALGIDPSESHRAVELFRDYYDTRGRVESELFPGMRELLEYLHDSGVKLGVATMKLDEYARKQVEVWGLEHVFDSVHGSDMFGTISKGDLIDMCLYDTATPPSRALMVGDTPNDLQGARLAGVDFLAVTFGFGFTELSCRRDGLTFVNRPADIAGIVIPDTF